MELALDVLILWEGELVHEGVYWEAVSFSILSLGFEDFDKICANDW